MKSKGFFDAFPYTPHYCAITSIVDGRKSLFVFTQYHEQVCERKVC